MMTGMNPLAPIRLQSRFRPKGNDQIRLRPQQLRRGDKGAAWIVYALIVDGDSLAFAIAQLSELRKEGLVLLDRRRVVEGRTQEPEPNQPAGLLRARRNRPRGRRAAKQRDELAPFPLMEHR
jgi:hypothetical protein